MKKVSILVHNTLFYDSRVLKTATSLSKRYQVEIVCLHDEEVDFSGKNYNFKIKRLKIKSKNLGKGLFINLMKFFEFMYKSLGIIKKSDFVHANDLPMLPIAVLSKLFGRKRVIYDAHEWEIEQGPTSRLKVFIGWIIERAFIGFADKYICAGYMTKKQYAKVYGVNEFEVVLNVPNFTSVKQHNYFRKKFDIESDRKLFLFSGLFTGGRDLENITKTFCENKDDIDLILLGFGPMTEEIKSLAKNHSNIHYHPAVPPENVIDIASSADFGIAGGEPGICFSFDNMLPNKFFTYFMAELPIVCPSLPEMERIITKYNIGTIYHPKQDGSLISAIKEIIDHNVDDFKMSLKRCKEDINWENQEKKIYKVYNS